MVQYEPANSYYNYNETTKHIEIPRDNWNNYIADYHKHYGRDGKWYITHYNSETHGTDLVPVKIT
jgi:hypothetical protein